MIRRGSIVTSAKRYDLRNEEDSNWMKHVKNDQKPSLKEVMEIYHKETKKKDKPDLFDLLNWYDRYLKSKKKASEGKWEPAPTAKDKERKEVGKDKDGNPVYTYRDKGSKSNDRPETQPEPKTDGNTQNLKNKIESISKTISDDIIQKIKSQTPKKPAISEKTNEQVKNILGNVDLLKLVHKRAGKSIDKKPHLKEYVKINAEDFGDAIIVALDNIKDKVKEDTPPRFLVDEIIKSDEHLSKAANIPDLHDDVKGIVEDTVYRFFAVDKSRKVDQPKLKSYEKSGFTTNISERVDKSFKVKVDSFVHNELAKAVGNNDVPSYVKTLYKKAMIRGQVEVAYGNGYTNEKEVNNIDNLVNRFASSESDLGVKGARISKIVQSIVNESEPDWRQKSFTDKEVEKPVTNDEKIAMMEYMKKEQEVLVSSGLVDEDGYVTVYRQVSHVTGKSGTEIETDGNYVDSWTIYPDLKLYHKADEQDKSKFGSDMTVIKAKVPLNQVIASCIGRSYTMFEGDEPITSWPNAEGEGEIMVSSRYVKAQIVFSKDDKAGDKERSIDDEKNRYYREIKNRVTGKERLQTVSEMEKHLKEELNGLDDVENPTQQQLIEFKKHLGEKGQGLSMDELLILFKTIMKGK